MNGTLSAWNLALVDVLKLVDGPARRFGAQLVESLRTLSPATAGDLHLLRTGRKPVPLYTEESYGAQRTEYLTSSYMLDPYYYAVFERGLFGTFSLRDIAPTGFEHSEIYRRYYLEPGICDDISHFFDVEGQTFVAGIVRTNEMGRFTKAELARHRAAYPAIAAAVRLFSRHRTQSLDYRSQELARHVEGALATFGTEILTPREYDVVRLLLCGHDTRSVGQKLDIATDTVKLHRRHAYAKLEVRNQNELFNAFLTWASARDLGESPSLRP